MKASILVVDDEKLIRWSLRERLTGSGHEVAEAETLAQARIFLRTGRFDLLLLDLRLPDGGGLDFLGEMQETWKEVPVILITAYSTVESAVAAMRRGAFDYVTKPFNMDDLEITVDRALELHRMRRRIREVEDDERERFGLDRGSIRAKS